MSEERADLFTALCKFQKAATAVPKGNTANVPTKAGGSFRYSYADLAGVIEHTKRALADNGLCVVQSFDHYDREVVLVTTLGHESGQSICSSIPIRGDNMNDPQKMGGLISYYRRYALLAILGLATEDDDANQARQPSKPRNAPQTHQDRPGRAEPPAPNQQAEMSLDDEIIAGFYTGIAHATNEREVDKIGSEIRDARLTDQQKEPLREAWRKKKSAYAAAS